MLHGRSHLHQPIALTPICKQPNYSIPRDFNSFRNTLSCTKFFVLFSFILSAVVSAINTAANMDHPRGYKGMSYACGMQHCFDGEKQSKHLKGHLGPRVSNVFADGSFGAPHQ